jgi:hypothetical protein
MVPRIFIVHHKDDGDGAKDDGLMHHEDDGKAAKDEWMMDDAS